MGMVTASSILNGDSDRARHLEFRNMLMFRDMHSRVELGLARNGLYDDKG
jgi:hypothetical protein